MNKINIIIIVLINPKTALMIYINRILIHLIIKVQLN